MKTEIDLKKGNHEAADTASWFLLFCIYAQSDGLVRQWSAAGMARKYETNSI